MGECERPGRRTVSLGRYLDGLRARGVSGRQRALRRGASHTPPTHVCLSLKPQGSATRPANPRAREAWPRGGAVFGGERLLRQTCPQTLDQILQPRDGFLA
ncbi:hypothetical protein GCM10027062_29360 [Nocardioides hungaricus]